VSVWRPPHPPPPLSLARAQVRVRVLSAVSRKHTQRNSRTPLAVEGHNPFIKSTRPALGRSQTRLAHHSQHAHAVRHGTHGVQMHQERHHAEPLPPHLRRSIPTLPHPPIRCRPLSITAPGLCPCSARNSTSSFLYSLLFNTPYPTAPTPCSHPSRYPPQPQTLLARVAVSPETKGKKKFKNMVAGTTPQAQHRCNYAAYSSTRTFHKTRSSSSAVRQLGT
jgi:hypothetical protein